MKKIISDAAIQRRGQWVETIRKLSGNFSDDFSRLETQLKSEIRQEGVAALVDHIRLCGSIPESYSHDSSEEKLYSKYTDSLIALAFQYLGLKSIVLTERGDVADVEVFAKGYDFVADAKAFRLSRTAKNQKDFKVNAMHGWKHGKSNAMVVCPIYQLPRSASQIYKSATVYDVCVFTYSHLSLLLCLGAKIGEDKAQELLSRIFKIIPALNPSKNATDYWLSVNKTMLDFSPEVKDLWLREKKASDELIEIARKADLGYLASVREGIMKMEHEEALRELVKMHKIDSKTKIINLIADNGIFELR